MGGTSAAGGGMGGTSGTGAGQGGSAGSGAGTAGSGPTYGVPQTLLADLENPERLVLDDDWVYLTVRRSSSEVLRDGSVVRVRKDGSTSETLADQRLGPLGLVLDGATVYWSETNFTTTGDIYHAAPGGVPQVFRQSLGAVHSLAADDQFLFWGSQPVSGTSTVSWATKANGMDAQSIPGFSGKLNLLLAPSRQWVVVLADGNLGSNLSSHLTVLDMQGETVKSVETGSQGMENGVVLPDMFDSTVDRSVAFTMPEEGWVAAVLLDEALTEPDWPVYVTLQGLSEPWGIARDDDFIYFAERDNCSPEGGTIQAIPLAGNWDGNAIPVASGLRCPTRLAVDQDAIYLISGSEASGSATGALLKIPITR